MNHHEDNGCGSRAGAPTWWRASSRRSPEEFAALVRADTARYAKIVKDIGLRMD